MEERECVVDNLDTPTTAEQFAVLKAWFESGALYVPQAKCVSIYEERARQDEY